MKFKKYTVFIVAILLSTLHSAGLQELEFLDEQTQNKTFASYRCAKRAFTKIKSNVDYFWPFISTTPNYLMRHTASWAFALYDSILQYISPSSTAVSFHKRQLWSVEKPYKLEFKPNREPINIHNMLVKFHPRDPHLLHHKEADFMKCITPSDQAATYGGELLFIDTSSIKGTAIHNPSIIEHQGKLYMTLRVQGHNSLPNWRADTFLAEMTKDFQILSHYPLMSDNSKTHEDARLVSLNDNIYVSFVTDITYKFGFYRTCMEIGKVIPGNQIVEPIRPNIDDNIRKDALQKNWLFFEKDKRFLVISTIDPMVVHDATGDIGNPVEIIRKPKVIKDWPFGQIRSSTTPLWIKETNKYLSFFHSHLITTNSIREYFLGALLFDNDFNITHYSRKPLFVSTPHIKRFLGANTILPYGCIRQGDNLILSVGINDRAAAIVQLPVKRIISELSDKKH